MEAVIRAVVMYLFLMIIIRISGKRTLSEMNVFDFVLLLIIGDSSQQAITGKDYSIINAVIVIITFIVLDVILSFFKQSSKTIERIVDGSPLVLINNGDVLKDNMQRVRIDESDILEAARMAHGLENLKQVRYAILEKDGGISIIPEHHYARP